MSVENTIADFLKRTAKSDAIIHEENIFDSGYVNSLFAMQIVMFVQKEFDIEVADSDLKMENFKSLRAISDLVKTKLEEKNVSK